MGLVMLPFLLGALMAGIMSIVHTIIHLIKKEIGVRDIGVGIITTGILFGAICLKYITSGSAWALSAVFIIPTVMILLPYIVYFVMMKINKVKSPKLVLMAKGLLICTVISTILGALHLGDLFDFPRWLGVSTHY